METVLINHILEQRKLSAGIIKKFLRRISQTQRRKKEVLITQIMSAREASATRINNAAERYLVRKRYSNLSFKLRNYYSLSPSFNSKVTKMSIRIYTNLSNINDSKIYNLPFCPLRKRFVLDINKKLFRKNKNFYFNFIVNGSIVIDSNYETMLVGGNYINKIDFQKVDERIKYNCIYVYSLTAISSYIKIRKNTVSTEDEEVLGFSSDEDSEDEISYVKRYNLDRKPIELKLKTNSTSSSENPKEKSEKFIRSGKKVKTITSSVETKPILRKNYRLNPAYKTLTEKRKVSFGCVFFSS